MLLRAQGLQSLIGIYAIVSLRARTPGAQRSNATIMKVITNGISVPSVNLRLMLYAPQYLVQSKTRDLTSLTALTTVPYCTVQCLEGHSSCYLEPPTKRFAEIACMSYTHITPNQESHTTIAAATAETAHTAHTVEFTLSCIDPPAGPLQHGPSNSKFCSVDAGSYYT